MNKYPTYFITHIGKRTNNEDSGGIFYNQAKQPLMIVCDGVGGLMKGEKASEEVTNSLRFAWEQCPYFTPEEAQVWLVTALHSINKHMFQRAEYQKMSKKMGTTIVLCAILSDKIVYANLGDARGYAYVTKQGLLQITDDHSFVGELLKAGEITSEQARKHPKRSVITRAVGVAMNIQVDIYEIDKKDVQLVLLCSDGLSGVLVDMHIKKIIDKSMNLKSLGKQLVKTVLAKGGKDNITIALLSID